MECKTKRGGRFARMPWPAAAQVTSPGDGSPAALLYAFTPAAIAMPIWKRDGSVRGGERMMFCFFRK